MKTGKKILLIVVAFLAVAGGTVGVCKALEGRFISREADLRVEADADRKSDKNKGEEKSSKDKTSKDGEKGAMDKSSEDGKNGAKDKSSNDGKNGAKDKSSEDGKNGAKDKSSEDGKNGAKDKSSEDGKNGAKDKSSEDEKGGSQSGDSKGNGLFALGKSPEELAAELVKEENLEIFEAMCYYMPDFTRSSGFSDTFWKDFLFYSYTSPDSDQSDIEITQVKRETMGMDEMVIKVSEATVRKYVKNILGVELPDFKPAFEDMPAFSTAFYYQDGYYYIGVSDFPDIWYKYDSCKANKDNVTVIFNAMSMNYDTNREDICGQVTFTVEPFSQSENGFIFTEKSSYNNLIEMNVSNWKEAYIRYIEDSKEESWNGYSLLYLNDDDIPELYLNGQYTAQGDRICTFNPDSGRIHEMYCWIDGVSYLPQKNLLSDSGGHMDYYFDYIYAIENGYFTMLHKGEFWAESDAEQRFDAQGNIIYTYRWDGVELTDMEYQEELGKAFELEKAVWPSDEKVSADEMIKVIQDMK